jgi:hypothetical protein
MLTPSEPLSEDAPLTQEVVSDASDSLLDRLFGDAPEEVPLQETPPADPPQETPPDDAVVEDDLADDSDAEVDWDAEDKPKEEENPKDESAARQQAKIKGREAKELKAKLTERELEIERITKERSDLQTKLEEMEATKIKPEDHPDYSALRDEILTDVSEASDLLAVSNPSLVSKNFGVFMSDYLAMSALSGDERAEARVVLKGVIVDKLGLSETPYAELEADERKEFEGVVTDVLKLVQRNSGKTKDLQKLHANLSDRAKTGLLSTGVRQYENTVSEFRPVLDSVGSLADDVIEANPYAVESIVSRQVKESPEAAKRLEKAKADVLEVIVGPRALTQTEIDKLEAAGENVKEFMAERAKSHRVKQLKFASMFVQGLMTRSTLKDTLSKLSKLEKDTEAEESELDVLRKTSKKSAAPAEKPKAKGNPLAFLGIDDDD